MITVPVRDSLVAYFPSEVFSVAVEVGNKTITWLFVSALLQIISASLSWKAPPRTFLLRFDLHSRRSMANASCPREVGNERTETVGGRNLDT